MPDIRSSLMLAHCVLLGTVSGSRAQRLVWVNLRPNPERPSRSPCQHSPESGRKFNRLPLSLPRLAREQMDHVAMPLFVRFRGHPFLRVRARQADRIAGDPRTHSRAVPAFKLFNIKCAWFNEEEYSEVFPRTLFARHP